MNEQSVPMKDEFWRGIMFCLLSAFAWALAGPAAKLCYAEGISPATVTFWRLFVAALCFLIHAAVRRELMIDRRDIGWLILFGMLNVSLVLLCFQTAIEKSGASLAVILIFTAPLWVALLSRILFHEVLSRYKILCLLTALVGTALVCASGGSLGTGEISVLGLACGLLSGFGYACQFIFVAWWKNRYSTATLFAVTFPAAAFVLAFFADFGPVSLLGWAGLILPSLVCTYLAYYCYGQALRSLSPVQAAIIGNTEPLMAVLLSWWLWNENFTAAGWGGCALIMGSVLSLALKRQN